MSQKKKIISCSPPLSVLLSLFSFFWRDICCCEYSHYYTIAHISTCCVKFNRFINLYYKIIYQQLGEQQQVCLSRVVTGKPAEWREHKQYWMIQTMHYHEVGTITMDKPWNSLYVSYTYNLEYIHVFFGKLITDKLLHQCILLSLLSIVTANPTETLFLESYVSVVKRTNGVLDFDTCKPWWCVVVVSKWDVNKDIHPQWNLLCNLIMKNKRLHEAIADELLQTIAWHHYHISFLLFLKTNY